MTSNLYSRVLLGTFIVIISVAIALGFLLPKEDHENQTGITRNNDTLGNCHPDPNATQSSCEARECIWQDVTDGSPPCTFPHVYGYIISDGPEETDLGWRATLQRVDRPSMFGDDLDIIIVDVEFYTETMVRIKFSDVEGTRFRVPEEAVNIPRPDAQPDEDRRLYDVFFENSPQFGVRVVRRSSGTVVRSMINLPEMRDDTKTTKIHVDENKYCRGKE